jgi:response regulator RpfG family c-di-GMP phosphodiesterase
MSEHEIKNQTNPGPQDKATYVVQSYYDQDDSLIAQKKFHILDGELQDIQNLTCDELKQVLIHNGIWPQYTKRIKNLEKVEQEFWNLYEQEIDLVKKARILEDIGNLQSVVSNCYATARDIIIPPKKGELNN